MLKVYFTSIISQRKHLNAQPIALHLQQGGRNLSNEEDLTRLHITKHIDVRAMMKMVLIPYTSLNRDTKSNHKMKSFLVVCHRQLSTKL